MNAVCRLCESEPFAVPAPLDPIGVTLMQEHLRDKHGERPKPTPGLAWGEHFVVRATGDGRSYVRYEDD